MTRLQIETLLKLVEFGDEFVPLRTAQRGSEGVATLLLAGSRILVMPDEDFDFVIVVGTALQQRRSAFGNGR